MATCSWQGVLDNENLLMEILLLIPAKDLVKLKPVCRMWNSIIKSDMFTRIHTRLHPLNSEPTSVVFLQQSYGNPVCSTLVSFRILSRAAKLLRFCNRLPVMGRKDMEKRQGEERRSGMVGRWRKKVMACDSERNSWRRHCEDRVPLVCYDVFPSTATLALF